jgi:hypothetical protein
MAKLRVKKKVLGSYENRGLHLHLLRQLYKESSRNLARLGDVYTKGNELGHNWVNKSKN